MGTALSLGLGFTLAYVSYPPPGMVLKDIANVRVEFYQTLRAQDRRESERRVSQLENLIKKLPAAQFLRHGRVTEAQKNWQTELLYRLDVVYEFVLHDDFAAARTLIRYVEKAALQCQDAFVDRIP